jgi:hypothetical protein
MKSNSAIVAALVVLVLAGIGYTGYQFVEHKESGYCSACQRTIHDHTRTVAVTGGKRLNYCCPSCALTEHRQAGVTVEVVQLTDFETGARLRPEQAVIVKGSSVNSCQHGPPGLSADKQPLHVHFDRCSPSVLAFAGSQRAEAFAARHGGRVTPFSEMAAAYR